MATQIRKVSLVGTVGLVLLGAIGLLLMGAVAGSGEAQAAASKGEVQIDLVVGLNPGQSIADLLDNIGSSGEEGRATGGGDFQVDSFFDIAYLPNIGSSGEDGVSATEFNVDSFFDITYEVRGSGDSGTFDTEMVSMSLTGSVAPGLNPGVALDQIIAATKGNEVFYGHVTVLK